MLQAHMKLLDVVCGVHPQFVTKMNEEGYCDIKGCRVDALKDYGDWMCGGVWIMVFGGN